MIFVDAKEHALGNVQCRAYILTCIIIALISTKFVYVVQLYVYTNSTNLSEYSRYKRVVS